MTILQPPCASMSMALHIMWLVMTIYYIINGVYSFTIMEYDKMVSTGT